jgi:hypothetical protein
MKISISLLTGFLLAFTVNAQIRMPIWGWSSPNEKLILSFHSQKKRNYSRPRWKMAFNDEWKGVTDDVKYSVGK